MKKFYFVFIFISILFISNFSFAQLSETTMKDILKTVSDKTKYLEDTQNKEIVNITMDLLVGTRGEKKVYRFLDNSFDYSMLLIGDRRISELKVDVSRKSGDVWIKVDNASGNSPQLEIYPDDFALYEFVVKAVSFNEDNSTGHFAFLLYHDDPMKNKKENVEDK